MPPMRHRVYLQWSEEDEAWRAEVPDLPGCGAGGETPELALKAAQEAAARWLAVARREDRPIPEPRAGPSGRFVVRLPRSLHRRLQLLAEREDVSLNQLVTALLAEREAEHRARAWPVKRRPQRKVATPPRRRGPRRGPAPQRVDPDELVAKMTRHRDALLPELTDIDPGDLLLILQCLLTPLGSGRRFFLRETRPGEYVL